ncbi:MAG: glutamine synthetase family protein [Oscillospiraceae bacterium]|jgi:glutamine synthetase|nr:glutamine synthetase family protein [Oscillospiraceae bacterium]
MNYTRSEVTQFIRENDVKFIRLAFCDLFGIQKNISIMTDELENTFRHGAMVNASLVRGFDDGENGELFLFPDPATMTTLPWRPSQGRVVRFFCDVKNRDGSAYYSDGRYLLKKAVKKLKDTGYSVRIGTKSEFYLFKLDEDGKPTATPNDNAGFMDIAPADKGENVRREICLTLEEMGTQPTRSHHEQGPGQNEIEFKDNFPLEAADELVTFRSVVKTIAQRSGLYATFLPRPLEDKNGSGLHITFTLCEKNGEIAGESGRAAGMCFMAGIMENIASITAFLNPLESSYDRLGKFTAPNSVSWSRRNGSHLFKTFDAPGKFELRSPDSACNPYLAFALLIEAGADGVEKSLKAPGEGAAASSLPAGLGEAIALAGNGFAVKVMEKTAEKFLSGQRKYLDGKEDGLSTYI